MITKKMISIQKFNKSYNGKKIYTDINIGVEAGDFICIIGPNGCGKTTLLKSIAKLTSYEGSIKTNGSISMVGQNPEEMLLPWLSIQSNIVFPKKESDVNQELLSHLLQTTNLDAVAKNFPYQLSGGMQQLLLIARSLLHNSDIILLDEPFNSLDFHMSRIMQKKVIELWNIYNPTIVMVSHNIDEAIFMANKIIILSEKPTTVKKTITIDLPRKRDWNILTTVKFNKIREEILAEFMNEL